MNSHHVVNIIQMMYHLPVEIFREIMCFLDRPTNHVYRQVCHEWCAIIDTMTVTEECPFTFLEERRRREIATQICDIMMLDVDTSHPMYLREFARSTRLMAALWHMKMGMPSVFVLTYDEEKRIHAKISTWLLLSRSWISNKIRGDAISALDNTPDEVSFHKFWGITALNAFQKI